MENICQKAINIIESTITGYDVTMEDLKSKSRNATIVRCRHISMYLIVDSVDATYEQIGLWFNRDHSSVLSAKNKIADYLTYDKKLKARIEEIQNRLISK